MFVAGLSGTRDRSESTASASAQGSSSRRPSDARQRRQGSGSGLLDPAHSSSLNSLTTPITSPSLGQKHAALPSSPPALASPPALENVVVTPPNDRTSEQEEKDREFEQLIEDLSTTLEGRNGQGKFWLSEQERKEYRIVLVDKVSHSLVRPRREPARLDLTLDRTSACQLGKRSRPHPPLRPTSTCLLHLSTRPSPL